MQWTPRDKYLLRFYRLQSSFYLYLPTHTRSSFSSYPSWHSHVKLPTVLVHSPWSQSWVWHSSMSETKEPLRITCELWQSFPDVTVSLLRHCSIVFPPKNACLNQSDWRWCLLSRSRTKPSFLCFLQIIVFRPCHMTRFTVFARVPCFPRLYRLVSLLEQVSCFPALCFSQSLRKKSAWWFSCYSVTRKKSGRHFESDYYLCICCHFLWSLPCKYTCSSHVY